MFHCIIRVQIDNYSGTSEDRLLQIVFILTWFHFGDR